MRHRISLQGKNNEVETKGKNNRQGNKIKRKKCKGRSKSYIGRYTHNKNKIGPSYTGSAHPQRNYSPS